MKRALPLGLAVFLTFALAVSHAQPVLTDPLSAKVDAYVQPFVAGNNFSGAILIARGGKILHAKGYGLADYELDVANTTATRVHIASLSKSFTAVAILVLEERGKLRVEDTLSKFIPDYPNGDKITIHNLLTHTSGIPNVNDLPEYAEKSKYQLTLTQVIQMFKDLPLEFTPGARYRYSNSNYNLLAFIIEKVSGKSYGAFLSQSIFQPLAMKDSGNDDGSGSLIPNRASGYVPVGMRAVENAPYLNWSIKTGNGSLYSTVGDLYKWDRGLYTDQLLKKSTREKMFTDYGGFGYGWRVKKHFDHRTTTITGRSPGFTSSLERFVDDDTCIILTANTYSGITQSMADDLAAIVFGEKYEVPRPPAAVSAGVLESYVGRYQFGQDFTYNPGSMATVVRNGDELEMQTPGGNTYLIPLSESSFTDRLFGGIVTFKKDAGGGITQLTWNFGKDFVAERIK